ncbi:MAG: DUF721 domain-containing protein [Alphaproteobacteria bacterium]|nr:DUF721 domain-containing protein [Alphaproteobacteria bacterium]
MDSKRAKGPRAIGAETARATGAIRRKRGFFEASVFSDWGMIVGDELSSQCVPLRLVRGPEGEGGTLHVRVTGPLALELQHLEPQVVERINGFYGFRAIARLRLHQGPIAAPEKPRRKPAPEASAEDIAALENQLTAVEDPELRAALRRLGESVAARRTRHTKS